MANFPTVAELRTMSIGRLRTLDITTPEQELLVQSLVDEKVDDGGAAGNIFRLDVPDIQTPEQEAEWQKIMDERADKAKPKRVLPKEESEAILGAVEEVKSEPVNGPETKPTVDLIDYTITEEDLIRNPELLAKGAQAGDVIQIPKEVATTELQVPVKKPFCDFCDSKGRFHKKVCPTKKV